MRGGSLALALTALAMVMFPDSAFAWGAGVHVAHGSFVLENLSLIRPEIAAVISAHPLDYLYGCVSADIFIGKGYQRRPDHCHNWNVGMSILEKSETDPTRAYSYGYLTHLAADVVAHNYFVPELICHTPAASNIGHVYWEFRADRYVAKKHWTMASKVVSMHNHDNDNHIKNIVTRANSAFGAKKMVYKRAVRLSDLMSWRDNVMNILSMGRMGKVTRKKVTIFSNHALNLVVDLLRNRDGAVCLQYDPVGTDHIVMAGQIKKAGRAERRKISIDELFAIPDEITSLAYVGRDAPTL